MYNTKETAFEEFSDVTDPRVNFEIQVYVEIGVDSGGLRKQWFRLCNRDNCLRIKFLLDKWCAFNFCKMKYCPHMYQRKLWRVFLQISPKNSHLRSLCETRTP